MKLADAIQAWGRHQRDELDEAQLVRLGELAAKVAGSEADMFDVETMTKDDARTVMGLFDGDERTEVSSILNSVRSWAIARADEATGASQEPVTPNRPADQATSETVIMGAAAPPPVPTPAVPAEAAPPVNPQVATPPMAASMPPAQAAPPQMSTPMPAAAEAGGSDGGPPWKIIGGVAAAAIILVGGWFAFLRGSDDEPADETVVAATSDSTGQTGNDSSDTADAAGQDQTDTAPVQDTADTQDSGAAETTGDATTSSDASTGSSTDFSGEGSGDFCTVARQFDEEDPFENLSIADGELFFNQTVEIWTGVAAIAPPELAPHMANILAGLTQMRDIGAEYDFNFFDPNFGLAIDAINTDSMDVSTDTVDLYVRDVCGIENGIGGSGGGGNDVDLGDDDLPGFDPEILDDIDPNDAEALARAVYQAMGITPELAECLSRELGALDTATADTSLLTKQVCGTTLLEVMTNLGNG